MFNCASLCTVNTLILMSYRNLVTSLIQHEQIKTTLPKARDAARLAEKVCFESTHTASSVL